MSNTEEIALADFPADHDRVAQHVPSSRDDADARVGRTHRATEAQLAVPYLSQLSVYLHHRRPDDAKPSDLKDSLKPSCKEDASEAPIYVGRLTLAPLYLPLIFAKIQFEKADPRDPVSYSTRRKWVITGCAIFFTGLACSCCQRPISEASLTCLSSGQCGHLQPGFPGNDQRPEMHGVPGDCGAVHVYPRIWRRSLGDGVVQRRVRAPPSVHSVKHDIRPDEPHGCVVSDRFPGLFWQSYLCSPPYNTLAGHRTSRRFKSHVSSPAPLARRAPRW